MTLRLTSIFADRLFSHPNHPNARPTMNWKSSTLFILIFGLAALGCDDSDNTSKNNDPIITVPDAGSDGKDIVGDDKDATSPDDKDVKEGDLDAGKDTHSDLDTDTFVENDATEDGGFVPFDTNRPDTAGPGVSGTCENIEDLGVLEPGSLDMKIIYARTNNDTVRTSCRDFDADTKPEKIYKFQLSQRAKIKATGAPNYTFEIRQAPCAEESSILSCNPTGQLETRNLPSGMDFYLIVEDDAVLGEASYTEESENFFTLEIKDLFGGVECQPGQTECLPSSDDVKICSTLGTYETKTCPTTCNNGSCLGDTCADPIIVSTGSAILATDISVFSNKISSYSCEAGSGNAGQLRGGQEVVFFAPNVQIGQTIQVTTSADNMPVNMMTVIIQRDACGETAACESFTTASETSIDYDVQATGDYYVIVDAQEGFVGSENVNFTVSIN